MVWVMLAQLAIFAKVVDVALNHYLFVRMEVELLSDVFAGLIVLPVSDVLP